MSAKVEKYKSDGMPVIEKPVRGSTVTTLIINLVISTIGAAIALAIFYSSSNKVLIEKKIQLITANDLHYLYIAAIVFSYLVRHLNFWPMTVKSLVFNGHSKNLRANMYVYRTLKGDGEKGYTGNAIVLDEEGHIGEYNRANRSLTHFTENNGSFLATFLAGGFVFPFAAMVLTVVFTVGRFLHQTGYTTGYGSHGTGFGLSFLASAVLEGLCTVTVLKSFGLIDVALAAINF